MCRCRFAALTIIALVVSACSAAPRREDSSSESTSLRTPPVRSAALELQQDFARVAARVYPSTVTVLSYVRKDASPTTPADEPTRAWIATTNKGQPGFELLAVGSGFVVDENCILTCRDLLVTPSGDLAEAVEVELDDARRVLCAVIASEPTLNLAILEFQVLPLGGEVHVEPVQLRSDDSPQVGNWVLAIGNPYGPERACVPGLVASLPSRACYQEHLSATYLQASLRVQRQCYGGPLVDLDGRVLGMLIPRSSAAVGIPEIGVGGAEFVLPSAIIAGIYPALRKTRSLRSPWLGFAVMSRVELRKELGGAKYTKLERPRSGIYVENVFEPSPATACGIEIGDFLTGLDGNPINTPYDFQRLLYLAGIGRTVKLGLFRRGQTLSLDATIEERPKDAVFQ